MSATNSRAPKRSMKFDTTTLVASAELTGSTILSLDDALAETQASARPVEEAHEVAAA